MKKAVLGTCLAFASLMLASPAWAGTLVDQAVASLRTNPVYVDPSATLKLTGSEVNDITKQIKASTTPIYIAVLPAAAADEVGSADAVPPAIGRVLGGTVGTVAGKSFRAGSAVLPQGKAASLATLAFNAHHSAGLAPVLSDFIKRVQAETAISTSNSATATGGAAQAQPQAQPAPDASHTSGWVWFWLALALVLIIVIGAVVVYLMRAKRRADEQREAEEEQQRYSDMMSSRSTSVTGKRGAKGSKKRVNTEDAGASERVPEDHPHARYYDGGYYGGAYYGPGYYPNQFLQGMLWARLMDDDDDDRGGHRGGSAAAAAASSSAKSDFVAPSAPSGDWDSSGDKGSSGGGGDFGSSDDVSTPSYEPTPSYDPPSMPDFGSSGGDFGGGGGSGGGGDF
jgi:uncharacterized membrane protein YgcG